jgi:hypothetical protein
MSFEIDRQTTGFQLGTVLGTIFFTPINYTAEIYGFRYGSPSGGGTLTGTIVAELKSSRFGTLTGTVDVVNLIPAIPAQRDPIGGVPLGRVEGGDYLVGVIVVPTGVTASIEGVVVYKYVPGRLAGP